MSVCPHCETTVRHGERIGCCSGCGRLFSSTTAHDRHQKGGVCNDPETVGLVARIPKGRPDVTMWGLPAAGAWWDERIETATTWDGAGQ